ncbi:helix-turn-helix domain-containing protein [Roseinatronobacter monicus]|uniref:Replication initiation protein RepC n=1 Tax=Roseinatronobacter monicus TaxID=393481 RepID=A0A543K300_9RHOB|nr:helix-turn-helix domain-containing protein [Roseinatronobacter monicus]TQM89471.1 replication initiation protein RepC [Roseinatronobacter monicus]
MRHATETTTALAERTFWPCPNPYELLGPVRVLKKELGLTANDLAVLTALISFLPRKEREIQDSQRLTLTVVFPSNASLSERANGLDERTLRRSLGRLLAAELIERKSSANGKRFPLRYGGVIRDAFGIDLKPLIQRHDALATQALQLTEERERLRSLKAEALALRASLLQQTRFDEAKLSTLNLIRNVLRRATLTVDTVLNVISELRALGASTDASYGEHHAAAKAGFEDNSQAVEHQPHAPESNDLPATNGQNVRQIESIKKDIKQIATAMVNRGEQTAKTKPTINRDTARMAWEDFTHVAAFFPEPPRTGDALTRILYDLGRLLRINQDELRHGIQKAGAGKLLLVFDYLLARADTIRNPGAYFVRILRTQLAPT